MQPARVTPLDVTAPGAATGWSGSVRAQVIVRLFARWCLTRPLRTETHINAVLVDALVDARGYVSVMQLTRQLSLLNPVQVFDALSAGELAQIVAHKLPVSAANEPNEEDLKILAAGDSAAAKRSRQQLLLLQQQRQQQTANGTASSAASTAATDPAEHLFALDYRRALPFAHAAMSNYFVLLLSESVPATQLPQAVRGRITHTSARTLTCFQCATLVAWEEVEAPPSVCPQCQTSLCLSTIQALLSAEDALSAATASKQKHSTTATAAAAAAPIPAEVQLCSGLRTRLQRANCLGALLEQGQLFRALFRNRLVLVSRSGAVVLHPDRVFTAEEFAEMMSGGGEDGGGGGSSNGLVDGGGEAGSGRRHLLRRVGVRGTRRPLFVEPAGVTEEHLPGLRLLHSTRQAIVGGGGGGVSAARQNKQQQQSSHHHQHHSAAFPPWLRDETALLSSEAEQGQPQHNVLVRDLSKSSDSSSSSSSSASSENGGDHDHDDGVAVLDRQRRALERRKKLDGGSGGAGRSRRKVTLCTDQLLFLRRDDACETGGASSHAAAPAPREVLATEWQAVHAAERQELLARMKQRLRAIRRRRRIAAALALSSTNVSTRAGERRQRVEHGASNVNGAEEEEDWERVI